MYQYFFNGTIEDDKIKNWSLNSVDYVDYFLIELNRLAWNEL